MALLTPDQLRHVRGIIEKHHSAFVANTVSPEAMAPELLERLRAEGMVDPQINSMEDAYLYGALLSALEDKRTANMSYDQFLEHVRRHPVPLSDYEREGQRWATEKAAQWIVGLGNRVANDVSQTLIDADDALRRRTEDMVRDKTAQNIARRESVQQLRSDLGWATKDWTRDWDRIAATEKTNSLLHGQAGHYRKRFKGVEVFRRPLPGACKWCIKLHIGPDGHPRIFKLEDLEANGSNFGKKASEWLPVVGAIHPNCSCPMSRRPAGWGFDEDGDLVPGGEGGELYEGEEDLALAMLQEYDLEKAGSSKGNTVSFQGLQIVIESPKGSERRWTAPDGSKGSTRMRYPYGYVKRTSGLDEDEVDVYVGPDPRSTVVYVIEQANPRVGTHDEYKCMVGFSNEARAREAYRMHLDKPDLYELSVTAMDMDAFKRWLGASQARRGELDQGHTALVLPLKKAKGIPAVLARGDEHTGDRGPTPTGMAGVNLIMRLPRTAASPQPNRMAQQALMGDRGERRPMKVDIDDYLVDRPYRQEPRPVEVDASYALSEDERKKRAETTRELLEAEYQAKRGPHNLAEGGEDVSIPPVKQEKAVP